MSAIDIITFSIAQLVINAPSGEAFANSLVALPLEVADPDDLRTFLKGEAEVRQVLASIDPEMGLAFHQMRSGLAMLVRGGEPEQAEVLKQRMADVFRPMNGVWRQVQQRFVTSGDIASRTSAPVATTAPLTPEQTKVLNFVHRLERLIPDFVKRYDHYLRNASTPEVFAGNLTDVLIELDKTSERLLVGKDYDLRRLIEMEPWMKKDGLLTTFVQIAVFFPDEYQQLCQTIARHSLEDDPRGLIQSIRLRIQQAKEILAQR